MTLQPLDQQFTRLMIYFFLTGDGNYVGWGASRELIATGNGNVLRRWLWLEAAISDRFRNPVTPFRAFQFSVSPGHSDDGNRLAGPILRSSLFQGTAPDGQSNLYIAGKKTGLVNQLPVV
ncbi:hypothetical protein BDZ91DRAFT_556185 [Kalaharituber pfeilii]|nr:hypothetical protein BDZ91DRAFT_556185 [Kalaharituber pfeilii]